MKQNAIYIQRWFRTVTIRLNFIKLVRKIIFLQSIIRRKLSLKILNQKEIEHLFNDENKELDQLTKIENDKINMIPFMSRLSGCGYNYNGYSSHNKVNKILVSYNIYFDVNFAYPDGWMIVLLKWIMNLKEKENKNIQKVALGFIIHYYYYYGILILDCYYFGYYYNRIIIIILF